MIKNIFSINRGILIGKPGLAELHFLDNDFEIRFIVNMLLG